MDVDEVETWRGVQLGLKNELKRKVGQPWGITETETFDEEKIAQIDSWRAKLLASNSIAEYLEIIDECFATESTPVRV